MPLPEEENFPRGGVIVGKRHAPDTAHLFNTGKPSKPKKAKNSKQKEQHQVTEDAFHSALSIRGTLTYKKLQTGMVILGCVRHISNFSLEVELPGLCFTSVNITEISDPFTEQIQKQLEDNDPEANTILTRMFTIGEFLLVKITTNEAHDNGTRVEGTINPRAIYSDHNHNSFKKEMLIWSCVSSEADHGYEMTLGIKNCRAFLPFKNTNPDTKYSIGKPLWCVVHKSDATTSASILRVTAKSEHIQKATLEIKNLYDVIPGMKVEFITEKITAGGIQGKFCENFIGYVDQNYLSKPLKKLSDYQEGKLLTAYVLFVEPATKITHLSLRNLEIQEKPNLNVGDIVQAEVFCKSGTGVVFVFPNKQKGFVTNKRLINSLGKKDEFNINEAINLKFPVGSKHPCRIMDYNHISQAFICTPELSVIREMAFTTKDLTIGQLIKVTIVASQEEGLVVSSGHIRGFIPNLHISNVEYTNNVKKRYKLRQKLDARVLSIHEDKVILTMKPALVNNDECLTNIEDAEVGKNYSGVVVQITKNGALIVFYGNVKGWISPSGIGRETTDPTKYFFLGQVVNVYIWRVIGTYIYLSLFKPQIKSSLPNVGGRYCGIVLSVNEDGINIELENSKRRGFVPNNHLSSSLNLCNAIKNSFNLGDKMPDLMYVAGVNPQIFSRREALVMKAKGIPMLETLQVGNTIRCSYQSSSDKGIFVIPIINGYTDAILISKQKIFHRNALPYFAPNQCLIAKIEQLGHNKKEIELSVSLDDIFDTNVESVVNQFTQYLSELSYLRLCGKKQNWNICQYNPGDQVECKVEKRGAQGGCVVLLPKGVKGIAVPSLCPKTVKEGDNISGMVISHNFDKKFVDICLKSDIFGRINSLQKGNLKAPVTSSFAEKLVVKEDCIIAVLKHPHTNRQLVYLPTKLHENDFNGCSSYYENKKFKVCICGKMKRYLIGISKKMFLKLDEPTHKQAYTNSDIFAVKEPIKIRKEKLKKSTKKVQTNGLEETKASSESDSTIKLSDEKDLDGQSEEENQAQKASLRKISSEAVHSDSVTLPGVSSFFSPLKRNLRIIEDDESSEDDDAGPTKEKKKKVTPAERADMLRQEEERISKIEKELTDSNKIPESADQFDRLLVAHPNSSQLWTKYIAFHIAAAEIDKARAVAKRALDSINMTLPQEKFNIWIVLLNLENMFGTKESFDGVLENALKFNDSLQIFLRVIQMFAENGKYIEMEEQIRKVRYKHKQDPIMWLEIGKAYYQINKFKEARNWKDSALKSIIDKKTQMNLIVRFAIMEFKYGEEDQGSAIFETILASDPRKVNLWVTYVDQLVKQNRIDQARQVLEKSVCQQLPLKSMKSLFMKFRKFEEVHGSPETIDIVKQRAQEYVTKLEK